MNTLLHVGLSNAVAATVLAVLALAASRFGRRPALVHSLWLLVLLKLVTPPVWNIPLPWFSSAPAAPTPTDVAPAAAPAPGPMADVLAFDLESHGELGEGPVVAEPADPMEAPLEVALASDPAAAETNAAAAGAAPAASPSPLGWETLLAVLWLTTSGLWLVLAAWRTYCFQRLLRHAAPAPAALQKQARRVAERLGLSGCPSVWLMPGRVSPMLWTIGRARLLLPTGLWERLDEEQRATLLAHELAHLVRRDHWVRGLELVVTALYWWHPAVWLARRELREAEEQCCDAWVVWVLPRDAKAYATALVETVDFLSEARSPLPLVASGIGPIHDLRRRLTMIMNGKTPRRLTWAGFLAVVGLGGVLLPALPTWAQTDLPARRVEDKTVLKDPADLERARAEIRELEAHIQQLRVKLEEAQARLRQAQERMTRSGGGGGARTEERIVIEIRGADGKMIRRIEQPEKDVTIRRFDTPTAPAMTPRSATVPAVGSDRRMEEVERKLDALMREIENLRRELRAPRPGGPPMGGGGYPGGPGDPRFRPADRPPDVRVPGPGGAGAAPPVGERFYLDKIVKERTEGGKRIITLTIPDGIDIKDVFRRLPPDVLKYLPPEPPKPPVPPEPPRPGRRDPPEAGRGEAGRQELEVRLAEARAHVQALAAQVAELEKPRADVAAGLQDRLRTVEARLKASAQGVQAAEASREVAAANRARIKALVEKNVVSKEQVDAVEVEYQKALAVLEQEKARLAEQSEHLALVQREMEKAGKDAEAARKAAQERLKQAAALMEQLERELAKVKEGTGR